MCAIGTCSMDLIFHFDEQHFAILNPFYFSFLLLAVLQIERCDAFKSIFLGHCSCTCAESCLLKSRADL